MTAQLRSGDLARAAGVNPQTLRYYERRGLLPEPERSPGGHRLYGEEAVDLLRVVKAAQRVGFSLEEVAELLHMGRQAGSRHRRPRRQVSLPARVSAKLDEVNERIADLQLIAATLSAALEAGCEDLRACADTSCCPLPFDGLGTADRVHSAPLGVRP